LRTRAIALLKEEKPSEVVVCLLLDYLVDFGFIEVEDKRVADGFTKRKGPVKVENVFSSLYFLALPQKGTVIRSKFILSNFKLLRRSLVVFNQRASCEEGFL
jgi:hypothetical protein